MTIPMPWTFSKDDPAGPDLEDRLQENLDKLAQQFPLGIQNVSRVPNARAFNSANLVIATGVNTALTFDSNQAGSTAGVHSTTVNTSREKRPMFEPCVSRPPLNELAPWPGTLMSVPPLLRRSGLRWP